VGHAARSRGEFADYGRAADECPTPAMPDRRHSELAMPVQEMTPSEKPRVVALASDVVGGAIRNGQPLERGVESGTVHRPARGTAVGMTSKERGTDRSGKGQSSNQGLRTDGQG
jgi:hypothetical protein